MSIHPPYDVPDDGAHDLQYASHANARRCLDEEANVCTFKLLNEEVVHTRVRQLDGDLRQGITMSRWLRRGLNAFENRERSGAEIVGMIEAQKRLRRGSLPRS